MVDTPPAEAFPDYLMPLEACYDEDAGTFIDGYGDREKEEPVELGRVEYPWDSDAELLLGRIFAAAGTAAHELPDKYDPVRALGALPEIVGGLEVLRAHVQQDFPKEDLEHDIDLMLKKARGEDA